MFLDILEKQLVLKKIITQADWNKWNSDISISYSKDNYFAELKDAEILGERMDALSSVEDYIGNYISREWTMKNILKMDDKEIEEMEAQIEKEKQAYGREPEDDI